MIFHKLFFVLIFGMMFLGYSCSPKQPSQKDILSQNVDFLILKGNEFWEKRANPENAKWARNFLFKAHQMRPQDKETGLLYSRSCFFAGKYIVESDSKKDSLFMEGALTALSYILNISPKEINSETILNPGEGRHLLMDKIESTDKTSLPALYLWGLNLGEYIFSKPVRDRMKQKDLLESLFHRIHNLDPTYDFGGSLHLLGVLYSRIPGMDVKQAKTYFDRAIQMYPDCFSHRTARAEFYFIKTGHREAFHDELSQVLKQDPTQIPDIMPENLMEQERAKILLERESSLFE